MAIQTTTVSVSGFLDQQSLENGYYYTLNDITNEFSYGKIVSVTPADEEGVVVGFVDNSYTVKLRSAQLNRISNFKNTYNGVTIYANADSQYIEEQTNGSFFIFGKSYGTLCDIPQITVDSVKVYETNELVSSEVVYTRLSHSAVKNVNTLYVFVYQEAGQWYIDFSYINDSNNSRMIIPTITCTGSMLSNRISKDFIITYDDGNIDYADYIVTFDSQGGNAVAAQTVREGNTVNRPVDPTRSGYLFTGWYTEAELINAYDFNSAVQENFTLYAGWKEKTPTGPTSPDDTTDNTPNPDNTSGSGKESKLKNRVTACIFKLWNKKVVDFTSALNLPIIFNPVLDETLNTAQITLSDLRAKDYGDIDVSVAFEPNTRVTIMFEDNHGTIQKTYLSMIIAHDDCKMQRKDNSPYRSYKHVLRLIEQTKELERLSVDTLTFTNPIQRSYDSEAYAEWNIE